MRRRPNRGFTLVELMISVAIIGILASVAVPTFRNFVYRSRQSERQVIARQIKLAFDDYFASEGRFPQGVPGVFTWANCSPNPDWTPTTGKRPWRRGGVDDWQRLPFEVEGALYYGYLGFAWAWANNRQYQIEYRGDLDGDGRYDDVLKLYQYVNGQLQKPVVAPANRCDDCTVQWQVGDPNTF